MHYPFLQICIKQLKICTMQTSWGLTGFYHESVCMLHFHQKHEIQLGCSCDDMEEVAHQHVTHDVPRNHSGKSVSQYIQQTMDSLTYLDTILFRLALDPPAREKWLNV